MSRKQKRITTPVLLRPIVLERTAAAAVFVLAAVLLIGAGLPEREPTTRVLEALFVFGALSMVLTRQRRRRVAAAIDVSAPVPVESSRETVKHGVLQVAVLLTPAAAIDLAAADGHSRFGALLLGAAAAVLVEAAIFRRREANHEIRFYRESTFSLSAGGGKQLWRRGSHSRDHLASAVAP